MNAPRFHNTYSHLPDHLYVRMNPAPVAAPKHFAVNETLAAELGLDADWLRSEDGLAMLSGNATPPGAAPLAQAYAGHQFGGWVPQLGDGRAILLGEIDTPDGRHVDVQLKGSGSTPFSRGGDGRAALGPVIREFLVSEAMAALGIPTTRALAAVTTGEPVLRETSLPGAILTRIASSHIRVGTFQYFAARRDISALEALTAHVIARHYPQAETPLDLLVSVVERQAKLVAAWLSVGFIHGVMNTDNMALSGETIDYGPCAFMDEYHPGRVFSSIDQMGRYAYGNQPSVAAWNLAQFATCLLPLLGEESQAIDDATKAVNRFADHFHAEWLSRFGAKLGIARPEDEDRGIIEGLLSAMADQELDFTQTFHDLTKGELPDSLADWGAEWASRLASQAEDAQAIMRAANPVIIARNHRIEEAIRAATDGDRGPFDALWRVLLTPYEDSDATAPYKAGPTDQNRVTRTFCGT